MHVCKMYKIAWYFIIICFIKLQKLYFIISLFFNKVNYFMINVVKISHINKIFINFIMSFYKINNNVLGIFNL